LRLYSTVFRTTPLCRSDADRGTISVGGTRINAARKLAQFDDGKRVPATMSAIADAVRWAEEIMKAIDERWPADR